MTAPMLAGELRRVEILHRYEILDTPAELDFDELARLAARTCGTPIALITLVDRDRQWFKSRIGFEVAETRRDLSFCSHAIQQNDLFVVPDAQTDARFAANPLVTGTPPIRFYAGAPLITPDGLAIGTLCVIDRVPRELSTDAADTLRALSRQVVAQLELRRAGRELQRTLERSEAIQEALRRSEEFKSRIIESSRDCIKVLDLDANLLSMNAGGMEMLEICDLAPFLGSSWIEFWEGADREAAQQAVETARNGGVGRFVGFFATNQTHRPMWFDVAVSPIKGDQHQPDRLMAVSRDVTARHLAEEKLRSLAKGTASEVGSAFFRSLVRYLARGMGARYAFAAECTSPARTAVRTLAFWSGDDFTDNIEFELDGTPCQRVIAGEACAHRTGLQGRFPRDVGLVTMEADSYLGVPVQSTSGEILGHLAVIDTRPMDATPDDLALLQIFAARAGAEMERQRAETALRQALAEVEVLKNRLQVENLYLKEEIRSAHGFEEIVGRSPAINRVLEAVERVAPTDATVLLSGETGTGKELLARAIHARSTRRDGALIAVNCGAISAGLVESELFGHEKGAFTGAISRRIGRFELAHGGTLFLDEVGDLPLELQVKLLRAIQEGEIERVGGDGKPLRVDVRVIAATHCDLADLVAKGTFRADLFYRLNVFPLHAPALRERREDIPALVRHFTFKYASRLNRSIDTIPTATLDALTAYGWPGNIRELGNVIERAVILSPGRTLELSDWISGSGLPDPARIPARQQDPSDRDRITQVLVSCGWKVSGEGGAAAKLGLKPTTLESRMKKLGISRPT